MWSVVAGCAWIPPAEHAANQVDVEGDADADADADTDADADADSDADTDPVCVDDPEEQDDTVLTANPVPSFPYAIEGVLCPEDEDGDLAVPADFFEVNVAGPDVIRTGLGPGATTPCAEQDLVIDVSDHDGNVLASARGGCLEVSSGYGAGQYYVRVHHPDRTSGQQTYGLAIDVEACRDDDGDDWLAEACGGPDCDDGSIAVSPEAPETFGDFVDQDCDGGDDLSYGCTTATTGLSSGAGTLPCGDVALDAVWDRWEIGFVTALSELSVVIQNGPIGIADPIALLVDGSGTAHFGLEADGSQLDDEVDCDETTWDLDRTACPGQCVVTGSDGTVSIWVAQKDGVGCTADAEYRLIVKQGGVGVTASLRDDDVVLGFP